MWGTEDLPTYGLGALPVVESSSTTILSLLRPRRMNFLMEKQEIFLRVRTDTLTIVLFNDPYILNN
jgi:copper homeostasis protein CutC